MRTRTRPAKLRRVLSPLQLGKRRELEISERQTNKDIQGVQTPKLAVRRSLMCLSHCSSVSKDLAHKLLAERTACSTVHDSQQHIIKAVIHECNHKHTYYVVSHRRSARVSELGFLDSRSPCCLNASCSHLIALKGLKLVQIHIILLTSHTHAPLHLIHLPL